MNYHPHVEHGTPNRYFGAWCHDCGWNGCSCQLLGGQFVSIVGEYDDMYCPECDSGEIESHPKE